MTGRTRQLILAALVACAIAAFMVVTVASHAELVEAVPAAGSTVNTSPAEIKLTFSETLVNGSQITLFGDKFQAAAKVTTVVAGSQMTGLLGSTLSPATYTVQWSAISRDGHTVSGSYPFTVAGGVPAGPRDLSPWIAALVSIISLSMALLVWFLNRRSRL